MACIHGRIRLSHPSLGHSRSVLIIILCALIIRVPPLEAGQKEGPLRYPDLKSGGIAIGGVTTLLADSTLLRRDAMAQVFEIHFAERRRDLRLTGAARVHSVLGDEAYKRMLDRFEQAAEPDTSALAALGTALGNSARYIAFARVEEERVKRDRSQEDPDDDPKTDNAEIVKTVERTVIVRFNVYDLRNSALVWSTRRTGKEVNSTRIKDEGPLFGRKTVAGMFETIVNPDRGPEDPPVPDMMDNLTEIFDTFAKKLPKK